MIACVLYSQIDMTLLIDQLLATDRRPLVTCVEERVWIAAIIL